MRTNINQSNNSIKESTTQVELNKNVITEATVYSGVAHSARTNNKQNFDFLLAMATRDATQFDEFKQISTPNTFKDVLFNDVYQIKPKKIYSPAQPERSLALGRMTHEHKFKDAQLSLLLEPAALVEGSTKIASDVYYNMGYNEQITNKSLIGMLADDESPVAQSDEAQSDINSQKTNIHSIERPNGMDISLWFNTISEARSLDLVS